MFKKRSGSGVDPWRNPVFTGQAINKEPTNRNKK